MLKTLKRLFDIADGVTAGPAFERRPLRHAAAERALADLFDMNDAACTVLLAEARDKSGHLTAYFAQVSAIKRDFSMPQRVALIEHLWRIVYVHDRLDPCEDHFVRKIVHLLHVSNAQGMLARAQAQIAR